MQSLLHYRETKAYLLHEFVVMPNHLHVLLTPGIDTSLEKAVQLIKGGSSHAIRRERGNKIQIWQEGFHDWTVRDAADWRAKVEYIRLNPVRAKLVNEAGEWPYCSATAQVELDPVPTRYRTLASGAKAPGGLVAMLTPGLKSRPPENQVRTATAATVEGQPPENQVRTAMAATVEGRPPEEKA